jgi:hypothetical protein
MAGLDSLLFLYNDPFSWAHDGYHEGEVPRYAECRFGCGHLVRADRTDLLAEHHVVCPNFPANIEKQNARKEHKMMALCT